MLNYKKYFAMVLCTASFLAAAADQFQVTYLKGVHEPRLRKVITLENTAALFAQRLSQTLKQEVKVVPFEKAAAKTLFVITCEKTAGSEYAKCLQGKPGDSFIIRYPVNFKGKKNVCLLMSRDPWGYCYPGNFFLRKYLGYDIVFPGEFGFVIPDNSKWQMPKAINEKESPCFNTRAWTMNTFVDKEFARMSLGESRRNISWHTFGRIIDPKKYGKTHPEYFPLVRGKRHNAPAKQRCDWSPCVSNPDVQKLFVDYLVKNYGSGGSDAVELSVNDGSGNHCECAGCTAWDDPGEKAKGHYSNRYFTFYKKVLDAANKIDPEIKACILLYSDATSLVPAKVTIHPNLVGMSTKEATIRKFARKGMKRLGLWEHQLDYLYPLPRHYPQAMAAKLREMHSIGVREYFGEVYMIAAANAPKQYILARLLWDLKADPVKIMEEYCRKAYGPAAPFMKKYYDTWEQIYIRECKARSGKPKPRLMSYSVEWFSGVRPVDVKTMEKALADAEKSPMNDFERKRFQVVKNHFSYIRCLVENYLDCLTLRQKDLSLEEILKIHQRCLARDARFVQLWNTMVSKDKLGFYRRVRAGKSKKRMDTVFVLYRNAVKAYLHESEEMALRNFQNRTCAKMSQPARLAFWKDAFKKNPSLLPIATLIGENAGVKLKNHIINGDFKYGTPGDPAVKGKHPKLEGWYFYDEIGDVLADDYRNHWNWIKHKTESNRLCFGDGKYPEVRTYMYLTKGVYRFSFNKEGENTMSFNLYIVPNMHKGAFKDVKTLRSFKVRTPAIFSFNHLPVSGISTVKQTVLIENEGWHCMLIATPSHTPKTWDQLWNVKMEKLN